MSVKTELTSYDTRFEIHDSDGKVRGACKHATDARDAASRFACENPEMSFFVVQIIARYKSRPSLAIMEYNRV